MPRCQPHQDWDRNIAESERWAQTLPLEHPNVKRPYQRALMIQRLGPCADAGCRLHSEHLGPHEPAEADDAP